MFVDYGGGGGVVGNTVFFRFAYVKKENVWRGELCSISDVYVFVSKITIYCIYCLPYSCVIVYLISGE